LIDSGANSNFVAHDVVSKNAIKSVKLPEPIVVRMADGRTSSIDSYVPLVNIVSEGDGSTLITTTDLLIVKDLKFPVILGVPWLRKSNPVINWTDRSVKFPTGIITGESLVKERGSNLVNTFNRIENDIKEIVVTNLKVELELPSGVPLQYSDFTDVFYENEASKLPPVRSFDLAINLKDDTLDPPFLKMYNLSYKEEIIL
jgi:Retroviral aspartyl protease